MDKAGNFIGWLFVDGVNMSVSLVENGLAKLFYTAEGSPFQRQLETAEAAAKQSKLGLWKSFVEEIKVRKPAPVLVFPPCMSCGIPENFSDL